LALPHAHSPYAKDILIIIIEDDSQDGADHVDSHRATTYFVGPYVKRYAVVSTRYSQPNVLRTIEDIFGTEHINLNTYYARPMADLFDIHSAGKWDFKAVASTLLKLTTLFDPNTNINYVRTEANSRRAVLGGENPQLRLLGRGPRSNRALQQDPLGRPEGHARSRYQNALLESRSRQRHGREIGHIESQIARTIASHDSIRRSREWDTR